jgi:hypothetical protein
VDANEAYARSAARASAIGDTRSSVSEEDRRKRGGFFLPPAPVSTTDIVFFRWTNPVFFATMIPIAVHARLHMRPSFAWQAPGSGIPGALVLPEAHDGYSGIPAAASLPSATNLYRDRRLTLERGSPAS